MLRIGSSKKLDPTCNANANVLCIQQSRFDKIPCEPYFNGLLRLKPHVDPPILHMYCTTSQDGSILVIIQQWHVVLFGVGHTNFEVWILMDVPHVCFCNSFLDSLGPMQKLHQVIWGNVIGYGRGRF